MYQDRRGAWAEEAWEQVNLSQLSTLYLQGVTAQEVREELSQLISAQGAEWWDFSDIEAIDQPYEPLLSLVRFSLKPLNVSQCEAILSSSVYSPLLPLFRLPVSPKIPLWNSFEPPPFEEQNYHALRQEESIKHLLKTALDQVSRPTWILFPDAITLPLSTLKILAQIMEDTKSVVFVLPGGRSESEIDMEIRGPFLRSIEDKALFKILALEKQGEKVQQDTKPHAVMQSIQNFLAWRLWPDARRLIEKYESIFQNEVNSEQYFSWLCLQAELIWEEGKVDQAIFNFQALFSRYQKIAKEKRSDHTLYFLTLRLAQACFRRSQWENAKTYALFALTLVQKDGVGEALQAKEVLLLMDSPEFRLDEEFWKQTYQEVLTEASGLGWTNTLSYWLSRPDRYNAQNEWSTVESYLHKAEKLAKKLDNIFRLAEVYHAQALVHMAHLDFLPVATFTRKAERLFQFFGSTLKLAQLQNGFGYFNLKVGRFRLAETYFRRAYGTAARARSFEESAMALANLGILYLYCRHFEQAVLYLEELQKLLHDNPIETLSYHSQREIEILLALAYAHVQSPRFIRLFQRLFRDAPAGGTNLPPTTYQQESFFYFLVMAHEAQVRKNYSLAQKSLKKARQVLKGLPPSNLFWLPLYYTEYFQMAQQWGLPLTGTLKSMTQRAIQQAQLSWETFFNSWSEGGFLTKWMPHPRPALDFRLLAEAVEISHALTDWQQRVQEFNFLNAIQNVVQHKLATRDLLNQVLDIIHLGFSLDVSCVRRYFRRGKVWAQRQPDAWSPLEEKSLTIYLDELFEQGDFWRQAETSGKAQGSKFSSVVQIVTSAHRSSQWQFFYGTIKGALTAKDFRALGLASRLLATALDKCEQDREIAEFARKVEEKNLRLYEQANHDSLTGLYNRQFLMQKLEAEIHRFQRYPSSGTGLALLFWDLDHFKSYNDLFGHAAGDVILKFVGALLLSLIRSCDVAARFGGDEFVLLLPETTEEGALRVAERFFSVYAEGRDLHKQLSQFLGRPITPPQPTLSCSVGIAVTQPGTNVKSEDLLKQADEALYQVKRSGKNGIQVAFHGLG